jgi:hypothetical protein
MAPTELERLLKVAHATIDSFRDEQLVAAAIAPALPALYRLALRLAATPPVADSINDDGESLCFSPNVH